MQDNDEIDGLAYKAKKLVAKIRSVFRGPKPKRRKPAPSSPSNSTTVPTKKKPAAAKSARTKKPATTAAAARRKPRAKTAAEKSVIAAKAARTRSRNKGQMRTAEPKRQKSVVQYPYKKVELRHAWEDKGWGIDKEVSKSANAVRMGITGSGGHLRRQSVMDKKSRMRRGALAGVNGRTRPPAGRGSVKLLETYQNGGEFFEVKAASEAGAERAMYAYMEDKGYFYRKASGELSDTPGASIWGNVAEIDSCHKSAAGIYAVEVGLCDMEWPDYRDAGYTRKEMDHARDYLSGTASAAKPKARVKKGAKRKPAAKRKVVGTRTKKAGAAKKNPNWKPTAAQTRSLSPALLKGLRKYHTGR